MSPKEPRPQDDHSSPEEPRPGDEHAEVEERGPGSGHVNLDQRESPNEHATEPRDPEATDVSGPRHVNPLAALTLVLVFPRETFRRLALKPNWVVPLLFVVAAVVAKSLLSLQSGVLDDVLREEAMRTGVDIDVVRGGAPLAFVASGVIGVPVVMLLQSLFFMAVGRLFGGVASFRLCLSTIAYASVPVGVGALAAAALIPITHSPDLGADLTRFVDPASHPFLWGAARELGIVQIWFYLLVGIAAAPALKLDKRGARKAAIVFALVHILIMSWLGMSEARSLGAAGDEWLEIETEHAVLHFPEGTDPAMMEEARAAVSAAADRVGTIVGALPGRIDCYVYSSLGEKSRMTGDPTPAHGVPWGNAVHVAWEGEREVALVREMAKVVGARVLGKMYNPFIADGLSVHAGARWGGVPLRDVAAELMASGDIPGLAELSGPEEYLSYDRHIREVAAGSFASFLIEEAGLEAYRELYAYMSRSQVPLERALERALGDSLAAVESRWTAYIAGSSSEAARSSAD